MKIENNSVRLCCGGKACPVVKIDSEKNVLITDDYQNTIEITKEQAEMINEAVKMLEQDAKSSK